MLTIGAGDQNAISLLNRATLKEAKKAYPSSVRESDFQTTDQV
jgi:hypothetical protein